MYRAYKEALRQQRIQDSSAIYKQKSQSQSVSPDTESPQSTNGSPTSQTSTSSTANSSNSPVSPLSNAKFATNTTSTEIQANGNSTYKNGNTIDVTNNGLNGKSPIRTDKPVQKVIPSRNNTPIKFQSTHTNGTPNTTNGNQQNDTKHKDYSSYVKPVSPIKSIASPVSSSPTQSMKPEATAKTGTKPTRLV